MGVSLYPRLTKPQPPPLFLRALHHTTGRQALYTLLARIFFIHIAHTMAQEVQIIRYQDSKHQHQFELATKPGAVFKYRMGEVEFHRDTLLEIDDIFRNFSQGKRASTKEMEETFETTDAKAVAKIICDKGALELTADERERLHATGKEKEFGPI